MTIGAVGGSRPQTSYEGLEDMSIGNPMAHLARVLMESKDRQEESEDLAFDSAKARIEQHTSEEVDRLHDAADATFTSAMVSASLTVAGAALSAVSISQTPVDGKAAGAAETAAAVKPASVKYMEVGSKAMESGSGPAGKMLDKRTLDFQADASKARGAAAMARTDMDRADAERKRAVNARDEAQNALRASNKQAHDARMESIQTIRGLPGRRWKER